MHQRELVKKALAEAGISKMKDPKLRAFLRRIEDPSPDCWPQVIEEFREHHAEHMEALLVPIWNSGHKLIRVSLIYALDIEREKEVALLERFIDNADPLQDFPELRAAVETGQRRLIDRVAGKASLPRELAAIVSKQREKIKRDEKREREKRGAAPVKAQ